LYNNKRQFLCFIVQNTLIKIAPLLHAQDIKSLFALRTFDLVYRVEYDEFVKEFARHLVLNFGDRADTYVTSAMQVK
jgi:hypothetical protein